MAGGRPRCLSLGLTLGLLLLGGGGLHEAEASRCQHAVHKQVGDSVDLSSYVSPVDFSYASWQFHNETITSDQTALKDNSQFRDRLTLNPSNFSLTLRRLTTRDSGTFQFVSETDTKQRDTVSVCLTVHESLAPPTLTLNSTWSPDNQSCSLSLHCVSTCSSATYSWTARNRTSGGSRLLLTVTRQDGHTEVTCTVSNNVSQSSASKTVTCDPTAPPTEPDPLVLVGVGVAAGGVMVLVLLATVGVCLCRWRPAGVPSDELTEYATVTVRAAAQRTVQSCSLYETVVDAAPQESCTVYDKIQLSRMRDVPMSIYQDLQDSRA